MTPITDLTNKNENVRHLLKKIHRRFWMMSTLNEAVVANTEMLKEAYIDNKISITLFFKLNEYNHRLLTQKRKGIYETTM